MASHMRAQDDRLERQGYLLLAFDLLVAAIVARVVAVMLPSTYLLVGAIALGAGGVLAVMAAFVVDSRSA